MWLRFKIFIGYITLIALLSFTIYFFRKEQMKRNCLQRKHSVNHVANFVN